MPHRRLPRTTILSPRRQDAKLDVMPAFFAPSCESLAGLRKPQANRCRSRRIPPSSFLFPPAARSGLSLLEVLVSIFILSVGLLGVAALIPIGKLSLVETNISDRTGACGRAALREIKIRRMLGYITVWQSNRNYPLGAVVMTTNPAANPHLYWCVQGGLSHSSNEPGWPTDGSTINDNAARWQDIGVIPAFAFDPLGLARNPGSPWLGSLPRVTLLTLPNAAYADPIFTCHDDLSYGMPQEMTAPVNGDRPSGLFVQPSGAVNTTVTNTPAIDGNFSWFFTVMPSPGESALLPGLRRSYSVSVVLCHKRVFDASAERMTTQNIGFLGGIGNGGGTIQLHTNDSGLLQYLKTDQWVMLCDTGWNVAKWYRVVGVGDANTPYVSLVGPDWNPAIATRLVILDGVTGVYTSTVKLDDDAIWNR